MVTWKLGNISLAAMLLLTITSCNYESNTAIAREKAINGEETTPCQTCLLLIKDESNRVNHLGNPIYRLEAYSNGKKLYSLDAVTGRAFTQNADRDVSGTEAPLPDGKYRVSRKIVAGNIAEVGDTFIPVYPNFNTGRTDLGIHFDPSFDRDNGEDGTSGCIGLTTEADRNKINNFVLQYRPQQLIVNIR